MGRSFPFHLSVACALIATLAGCRPKDAGIDTASRDTLGATTADTFTRESDEVPVTTSSDEARTFYQRGRVLADQLRAHDARQQFEQAVAKDSGFALAHYELALNSGSPRESVAQLDRAVALSSKASEGERLMILALQAGNTGDSKKALELSQQLVDKYPRDPRAQTLLGQAYAGQQEFGKAVSQLAKATELDSTYAPAWNLLGYAYMPQGKYTDAEAAFKKYIALVPNDPNPYDSYGEMLMRTGRYDESIAQYRKALAVDPHFSSSYIGIASNLMFQGKHDAAAAQAQKLYDGARDSADRRTATLSRAVTYVDQGNTARAMGALEKLYAFDAGVGDTTAMSFDADQMGTVLLGGMRPDEAAKRYRQSLDLIEGSGLSAGLKQNAKLTDHYNLARVAIAKGDTATANAEARQYVTGAEATHDVRRIRTGHELTGLIALRDKAFDKAADELGQADQQDPYVLYALATAYQGKGDAAKTTEFAKRAADMNTLPTIRYALVRAKAAKLE
jgi:tetratricopeptide (TPR) repeat protein